jgi:hypothetical protein
VRVLSDRPHLLDGVQRAELGGLRDRHDERLRPVLVAPAPCLAVDQLGGQLAVGRLDREQLEARDPLGCTVLVGVDVRGLGADDGAPARQHRLQAEHVGAGSVEDGERLGGLAEVRLHDLLQARGVDVFAVGDLVPLVGGGDRFEQQWMHTGVVVRGEAAAGGVVQAEGRVEVHHVSSFSHCGQCWCRSVVGWGIVE